MDTSSDQKSSTSSNNQIKKRDAKKIHEVESNVYPLRNEGKEWIRLNGIHTLYRNLHGTNIIAPIVKNPTGILDIGTGSGRWALEVADTYPSATVWDLGLSHPRVFGTPPNFQFLVGDLTNGLNFDDASLDLVHSRFIDVGLKEDQWKSYIRDVYRVLKPETGWAQCTEVFYKCLAERDLHKTSAIRQFDQWYVEYKTKSGAAWGGEHITPRFIEAGFVDVKIKKYRINIGEWSEENEPRRVEVGRSALKVWVGAAKALIESIFRSKFQSEQEMEEFINKLKVEMASTDYRLHSFSYTTIGRKPDVPI